MSVFRGKTGLCRKSIMNILVLFSDFIFPANEMAICYFNWQFFIFEIQPVTGIFCFKSCEPIAENDTHPNLPHHDSFSGI